MTKVKREVREAKTGTKKMSATRTTREPQSFESMLKDGVEVKREYRREEGSARGLGPTELHYVYQ